MQGTKKMTQPTEWCVPQDFEVLELVCVFHVLSMCYQFIKCRWVFKTLHVLTFLDVKQTLYQMYPLQFAYRAKRGVGDASLTPLHAVSYAYAVLYMGFSAFNTMRANTLFKGLCNLHILSALVLCIKDFLHNWVMSCHLNWCFSLLQGSLRTVVFPVFPYFYQWDQIHIQLPNLCEVRR